MGLTTMLARLGYRFVAVIFVLGTLVLAAIGLVTFLGVVFRAPEFGLVDLISAGWAFVLAYVSKECASGAWRSARYDPLYHDYP